MPHTNVLSRETLPRDLAAGAVVFLVALPLLLGIALTSQAPLFSGVIAGVIGGILVGLWSGSHTSVSGPSASLAAIVAVQIALLGSLETFFLAVVIAGVIQIILGALRGGIIAAFFPTSVVKGLLAAIGVILVLKQIPHLLGHDTDPEGEMSFRQPDRETTFSEFGELLNDAHLGAAVIGLLSIVVLVCWERYKPLKKSLVPAPLVVVLLGVGLSLLFRRIGDGWLIGGNHLVQVPVAANLTELLGFFRRPDFSQWMNPAVYMAGLTIALVASLETLLNVEAADKLDPQQRNTPPSRELVAHGIGNIAVGMLGGIPVSSAIVRSSVNINAGGRTKLATVVHGLLLLICVISLPRWLNLIPISCLAAILLVTGVKLASPKLFQQMWRQGRYQFVPFVVTVVAIVLTDPLIGILIGIAISVAFIFNSNLRRPVRRFMEKHLGGDVLHIELANQVSFLNRAALTKVLDGVPRGGHVLLDAQNTDYIDPDVLDMIQDFKTTQAPARGVEASFLGFRDKYQLEDQIQYVDHSSRELQTAITPQQVLQILIDGHERFRTGRRLTRDLSRQVLATARGHHPLAVVLSCIDSRAPAELIFDLGVGDIFSARVAGNVTSRKLLGSVEYGCAVAGSKLLLVMGHTHCGAVTTAVKLACSIEPIEQLTGCQNVEHILRYIQESLDPDACRQFEDWTKPQQEAFINQVAQANVVRTVQQIPQQSSTLARLRDEGRITIVGAMYDVATGDMKFLTEDTVPELSHVTS